jgi:hypothetical protein
MSSTFEPVEAVIRHRFIPALLGGQLVNNNERLMLSLPGRFGGLALDNPVLTSDDHHTASSRITRCLTNLLISQKKDLAIDGEVQSKIKIQIRSERETKMKQICQHLATTLPFDQHRALLASQDKGASALVTTLPLERYGFALTKMEYRDQLMMRYRWPLKDLPTTCSCGSPFDIDHSQICHLGGFINMRHDEVRDIITSEMRHVFHDVESEPKLAPLTGEVLQPLTAITADEARADIRVRSFFQRQRNAFFDVRVFYPHASSYLSKSLQSLYTSMEKSKKREYGDRISQVEHGSFTPLIFSSVGGMGIEANEVLKRMALVLSEARNEPYSHTMCVLRCRIAFALMRASSVCLRGSRQRRSAASNAPAIMVLHEAMIDM